MPYQLAVARGRINGLFDVVLQAPDDEVPCHRQPLLRVPSGLRPGCCSNFEKFGQ